MAYKFDAELKILPKVSVIAVVVVGIGSQFGFWKFPPTQELVGVLLFLILVVLVEIGKLLESFANREHDEDFDVPSTRERDERVES
jgi:hypothetical protein